MQPELVIMGWIALSVSVMGLIFALWFIARARRRGQPLERGMALSTALFIFLITGSLNQVLQYRPSLLSWILLSAQLVLLVVIIRMLWRAWSRLRRR